MKVSILLLLVLAAVECAPQARTMDCKILGHTACKVHCLFTTGRWGGQCDENEDCHCDRAASYSADDNDGLEVLQKIYACLYLGGSCLTGEECGQNPHENNLCTETTTCCWQESE